MADPAPSLTKNHMVLNRKHLLITSKGHSVAFEKDKPVYVPPVIRAEAIAIGAVFADGSDANLLEDAIPSNEPPPDKREEIITEGVRKLKLRNQRGDFNAAGQPHPKVVSKLLGFRVDQRELNVICSKMAEAEAEAKLAE